MTSSMSWFGKNIDQDFVDSANGFWSVWLFSLCSVCAFFIRYVMQPITCWPPAQFEDAHVDYVTRTCFDRNMFYLPLGGDVPKESENSFRDQVPSYHLWVPLVLALQALGFKLPNIMWRACKHYLTVDLDETVASLKASQIHNQDNKTLIKNTAQVLRALLKRNKFLLGILYLVVKFLYCANLALQFTILTIFMRPLIPFRFSAYIPASVQSFLPYFSRVVFCDVSILVMTNGQNFSLQCTLHITEVYEKMYMFLWFWLLLLIFITNLNLLTWLGNFFIPFLRDSRISAYISASPGLSTNTASVTKFVNDVLGIDGVFLLTMISRNSSETIASDLVQEMFQEFEGTTQDSERLGFHDPNTSSSNRARTPEIKVNMAPDTVLEKGTF